MNRRSEALVLTVLMLGACAEDGSGPGDPAAVVEDYIDAYNAGDIEAVMALFSERSVVIGHPFEPGSTAGLDAIRALQVEDRTGAASDNPYTISNVEVTGATVSWDHVWTQDSGTNFCQIGNDAVIEDGKFVTWTWPGGDFSCPEPSR